MDAQDETHRTISSSAAHKTETINCQFSSVVNMNDVNLLDNNQRAMHLFMLSMFANSCVGNTLPKISGVLFVYLSYRPT